MVVGLLLPTLVGSAPGAAGEGSGTEWVVLSTPPDFSAVGVVVTQFGDVGGSVMSPGFGSSAPAVWTRNDDVYTLPSTGAQWSQVTDLNDQGWAIVEGVMQYNSLWQGETRVSLNHPQWAVRPHVLNDLGQVAGELAGGPAFRWQNDQFTELVKPDGRNFVPIDINNRGQILGTCESATRTDSVVWQGNSATILGDLGGGDTVAKTINDRGQVIGRSAVPATGSAKGRPHPFLWQNGVMIDLLAQAGTEVGEALAINNSGLIVGQIDNRPVVWLDGVPSFLAGSDRRGQAQVVNQLGEVAGVLFDEATQAGRVFVWRDGELVILDPPPGSAAGAEPRVAGIDLAGRVVVQVTRSVGEGIALPGLVRTMRGVPILAGPTRVLVR